MRMDSVQLCSHEPGAIRVMVSPSWRGTVETQVPGAHPVVVAYGPRWLRVLRARWWWWRGPACRVRLGAVTAERLAAPENWTGLCREGSFKP
jgi:hypothetical protein